MLEVNKILQGDCLEILKTLPDESINCCITSPPYWALRDYGVDGQLGLEPTFQEYIKKLCNIFDEIKRVLKKDGTCWVNLGDTYSGNKVGYTDTNKNGKVPEDSLIKKKNQKGIKEKTLLQIPSRFAIEMTSRGWILRNRCIWHKPNCMPSSAKDRFTNDYEDLFFFVKNKKYCFETQLESATYTDSRLNKGNIEYKNRLTKCNVKVSEKRNKRAVWKIPTKGFSGAHFAVYPEKLIEVPIKAGCPEKGIVLDPFMGSGTTAVVARGLGRDYIGIELNPEYIEIANKRLRQRVLF